MQFGCHFNLYLPGEVIFTGEANLLSSRIFQSVLPLALEVSPYSTGLPPNANEINTKKMKCTLPTRTFCVWDPTQPIFH